ncbi:MAG: Gfo/Idh/MocA family oxidoreductase [Pseudomonadota bacterium]
MTETIRWGILGAANFAKTQMGPAIHLARNATLAALATSSTAKGAAFQDLFPELRLHDSYDALLADPEIDAVYIPLPNHIHVTWTEKALAAGKPVLTEKPVGMSVAEVDQLIAARDASGCLAAEAFMILHHPQWHRAKQLVAEGAIGELVQICGAFTYDNRDMANIRNRAETGGGGLRDIGVYPIGAARFIMGAEPVVDRVDVRWEEGVDTFVDATCHFGTVPFRFYVGTRAHLWQEMTFHGTSGVLRVSAPFNAVDFGPAQVHLLRPNKEAQTFAFHTDFQYVHQVEAFGHSLRTGAPYPVPLEFSRGTQALIDAIFDAATA